MGHSINYINYRFILTSGFVKMFLRMSFKIKSGDEQITDVAFAHVASLVMNIHITLLIDFIIASTIPEFTTVALPNFVNTLKSFQNKSFDLSM